MSGPSRTEAPLAGPDWVDAAVGAGTWLIRTSAAATAPARSMVGRLLPVVLHPPGVPAGAHPGHLAATLAVRGAEQRTAAAAAAGRALDALVPRVLDTVLARVGLTDLVLDNVDLDAVVSGVDLDAAATRLDVDAVVARADLEAAIARVDLDSAVARVDLDAVVARVDVDAILDRLDLTDVVLSRVDLTRLVNAVLERVDLVGLAQDVIDGVDLPAIIRESTGSMASDTVRGARMQSIAADEAVGKAVDRLLLRRRHPPTPSTGERPDLLTPQSVPPGDRHDAR
jgi:hypothetical protein